MIRRGKRQWPPAPNRRQKIALITQKRISEKVSSQNEKPPITAKCYDNMMRLR